MSLRLLVFCAAAVTASVTLSISVTEETNGTSWYRGCYNFTLLETWKPMYQAPNSMGPAQCSKHCRKERFDLTMFLNGTSCLCANETEISLRKSSSVPNTDISLSKNGTLPGGHNLLKNTGCISKCFGAVCFQYGDGKDVMAVYEAAGPYIWNFSLSLIADQVQIGKPFMLEIYGYLASRFRKAIGIETLSSEDMSYVVLDLHWSSRKYTTQNITVNSKGFFTSSPVWTYSYPGIYLINVTVSNKISSEKRNISVEAVIPAPTALEVKLVQLAEQIPSCVPFTVNKKNPQEKVYLDINYTFKAFVAMGTDLTFSWYFSDDNSTQLSRSPPNCNKHQQMDCLINTVNHTFHDEGVCQVIVNVSNIYDWIQKTIYVAAVRESLSSLAFHTKTGYSVAVGANLTLEMDLFTTVRQLLVFDITFEPGLTHSHRLSDQSPAFESHSHLQLMENYGLQNCTMCVQIIRRYSTVGTYNISIGVYYDLGTLNASLAELIQVYSPINGIAPAPFWHKIISSRMNQTFSVTSEADKTGSRCVWTIRKGNETFSVKNTTEWFLRHSFATAGCYVLTVMASNPISNASYSKLIEVQDVIEGLSMSTSRSRNLPTGSTVTLRANVLSGNNVTYVWTCTPNSTIMHTSSSQVSYRYSQPGVYSVSVTAVNNVSKIAGSAIKFAIQDLVGDIQTNISNIITINQTTVISVIVTTGTGLTIEVLMNDSVVFHTKHYVPNTPLSLPFTFNQTGRLQLLVRAMNLVSSHNVSAVTLVVKEIHMVSISTKQEPVVGQDIILVAKVNEYLWRNRAYIYSWTLYDNHTVMTGSPFITYRCTKAGPQWVALFVSNLASTTSSELVLNVSDVDNGPRLSHSANVAAGWAVPFTFKNLFSDMGDVVIQFGDGNMTTIPTYSCKGFSINYTYPVPGIFNIDVLFMNSTDTLSSAIVIQDLIGNLTLTGPRDVSLSTNVLQPSVATWNAKLAKGSNYIFLWQYSDDMTNYTTVGPSKLIMEINTTGIIKVEVTAKNGVSYANAVMITVAQYPINGVILNVARIPLRKTSNIMLRVEPKQDYIIEINYGDGTSGLFHSQHFSSHSGCFDSPFDCSNLIFPHTYSAIGQYVVNATVSNNVSSVSSGVVAVVEEPITGLQLILNSPNVIKREEYINATAQVQTGTEVTFEWTISMPRSSPFTLTQENTHISTISYQAHTGGSYNISVKISSPLYRTPFSHLLPYPVKVRTPIEGLRVLFPVNTNSAKLLLLPNGSYTTQLLDFRVSTSTEEVKFTFDFGDGSPLLTVDGVQSAFVGSNASGQHKFTKEGVFHITIFAFNQFYNKTDELGAYFVQMVPEGLLLTINSNIIHKNEVILFSAKLDQGTDVTYSWNMGDQTSYVHEGPVIKHQFLSAGSYNVTVNAWNKVGSISTYVTVSILYRLQPVSIYTKQIIYATNSDIYFTAVTAESSPLQFLWYFGNKAPMKTTARSISTRYSRPGRYNVIVNASNQISSFTSDIYPVELQQRVEPNRLRLNNMGLVSVLLNSSVILEARINYGTNLSYLWDFGDGTVRPGQRTESHRYTREGEFTTRVDIFNNVSFATLSGHLFVISEMCEPPSVKNYGPSKFQIRRYQSFKLGVTFESEIACNISKGIHYHWSFFRPDGSLVTLPKVDSNKQSIVIPGYLLDYGIYLGIAKVQIVGSVVYNNYTVNVEVLATPPVSVISGGTHLFVADKYDSFIDLKGSESFDPDYPDTTNMRFSWLCEAVSALYIPCFKPDVSNPLNISSSIVNVPMSALKSDIDQFVFKLTVNNNDRYSPEAQMFVTIKKDDTLRRVKLFCPKCLNNSVNWNDEFSIRAVCEDCPESLTLSYSWKLYLVNLTETEHFEVPFCKLVVDSMQSSLYSPVAPSPATVSYRATGMPKTVAIIQQTHSLASVDRTTPCCPSPEINSDNLSRTDTPRLSQSVPTKNISTESVTEKAMTTTSTATMLDLFPFPIPEEEFSDGRPHIRSPRDAQPQRERTHSDGTSHRNATLNATSDQTTYFASETPQNASLPETFSPTLNGFGSGLGNSGSGLDVSEGVGGERPGADGSNTNINSSGTFFGEGSSTTRDNFTDSAEYDTHYNTVEGTSGSGGRQGFQGGGEGGSSGGTGVFEGPRPGSGAADGDSVLPDIQLQPALRPISMIDWLKVSVDDVILQSYTTTGIKSQTLTFKPFSLPSKSIYMLEVTVAGDEKQSGKAQLFFSTTETPQGITCEVRPSVGLEIETQFSMFCTSGRKDLFFEYSYSVGNSTEILLHEGMDHEYYFNLPAGDKDDGYKLTINTVITNLFGSKTKPCSVTPTVLPSINKSEELFIQGLKNLSALMLLGNQRETKNYLLLLTRVLYRLHKEGDNRQDFQTQTRNELIVALCSLNVTNQGELIETVSTLYDLVNVTSQVTSESAFIVTRSVKEMTKIFKVAGEFMMYEDLVKKLTFVVAHVMGVMDNNTMNSMDLLSEGLKVTTELLLRYVLITNQSQFYVNTNFMELQITQNYGSQSAMQSTGSTGVYLPDDLGRQISEKTGQNNSCFITHLISFKHNPYFWGTSPVQVNGDVADLTLYNCTNRRKLDVRGLQTPVRIEFGRNDKMIGQLSMYSLLRTQMNVHMFLVTPENLQQALQIRVNFTEPREQAFPIMLLVRFNKEPTPSKYNLKQIHRWDGNTIHVFIPAGSLMDPGNYYLGLLDADYGRNPPNHYLAKNVSYTLNLMWTQCLYWDDIREWKSNGCSAQKKSGSQKINCSCNHLTTFTIAHKQVEMKDFTFTDVLAFISAIENYAPCIIALFAVILYLLLVIVCKRMDLNIEAKPGIIVLQDNAPTNQHLYEITTETGFRPRAGTTAKVYITLYGENGVSETRELYHSEKQLFERNSRHKFIMSVPESLGPIWKVHLWHNNGGHSPSWYLSSVVVKDLMVGKSWFFPAECWLAVDEGDGKIQRELISLNHGPGFKKLLYSKLTEYLEDFHLWGSVYSRPSYSSCTHTQRLTVCLCLLLSYMCLNAVLTSLKDEEYTAELGLIDVSTVSLITGLITTVAVLPFVVLVSLLFRFSKIKVQRQNPTEEQCGTAREINVYSVEAHHDTLLALDSAFESYLSWQNLQQWAQEAWRKKYERGLLESRVPSIHSEHCTETSNKEVRPSSQASSSGFEDCSFPENTKTGLKDPKHSPSDLHSDYSSEPSSLSEQPMAIGARHFLPSWCYNLAWIVCFLIALVCVVTTSLVGLRFGPTKCILWLHSLLFSLLYCFFVIQPTTILCIAIIIALKNKDCRDFYTTSIDPRSTIETYKQWSSEARFLTDKCLIDTYYNPYIAPMDIDWIVAARQRARYLRLARPPTSAQLKEAKDRMRKETLIQQTLREFVLYLLMLVLLLLITFGKLSNDEYYLNQAIRAEFTGNDKNSFMNVKTADAWWVWSFSTLLRGLYWDKRYSNTAGKRQAGAVCGKCYLIGTPSLKQIEVTSNSSCEILDVLPGFIHDCGPVYSAMMQNPDRNSTSKQADTEHSQQCGSLNCYSGKQSIISLGRTWHEAYATLIHLKENEWIDRNTKVAVVEFTLYNPPTNLFTAVSLMVEMPRSGGVFPSISVESVSVYHINSTLDYFIMVLELLFLAIILLHFYLQTCRISQKGLLRYCQEPWNWLEVGLIVISLFYYMYYVYYFVLAVDIIDRLHSGYFKAFVDMSIISSWNQKKRFLHGLMLFLLLLKSISLLRINRLMAPCMSMLRMSYSSLITPMLCGIILIVAYSCLGNLLFLSETYSFSTFVRAFQTVLMYFMGLSEMRTLSTLYKLNQLSIAIYYGTFFVFMTILWVGLFVGILTSMAEEAKKSSRSKHLVTFTEVAVYTRDRILTLMGRNKNQEMNVNLTQGNNFYLDEFEDLMDELLFRLNAMSNSLHHTLPPKQSHYLEDSSPSALGPGLYSNQASENPTLDENPVDVKLHKLKDELFKNNREVYERLKPRRECASNSDVTDIKTLGSKLELETLHQRQLCQENYLCGKSESRQSGHDSRHSPKNVKTDSVQKDPLVRNRKSLTVDSCGTLDSLETSCNTILELCSIPSHSNSRQSDALSPEHYNLAKLGDTLPHVLCGIKCPEKQAAQNKVASQHRCSSASTSGKNRKQLKRSHTTFIQMLNNPSELSDGRVEISERLSVSNTLLDPLSHCLGNLTVQSSSGQPSSDKIPPEKTQENHVESEVKPIKRAAEAGESSALCSEEKTE